MTIPHPIVQSYSNNSPIGYVLSIIGILLEYYWLVVEPYPSEKYEFVNGKDDNPYMKWIKKSKSLKPPTRLCFWAILLEYSGNH